MIFSNLPRILFTLITLSSFLFSQAYIVPNVQRDDFAGTAKKTWWTINARPLSGNEHTMTFNNGYMLATLKNPVTPGAFGTITNSFDSNMENIGLSSANLQPIYSKDMVMEVIIRIKYLNPMSPGSRGFGFWLSEDIPIQWNRAVWFFESHAPAGQPFLSMENWWRARTHDGVDDTYDFYTDLDQAPWNIDNQQWHTYKVRRYSGSSASGFYEHYVDGQQVQRIVPADFPDGSVIGDNYTFNCWNDNLVYHFVNNDPDPDQIDVYYNGWSGRSQFVVDFVQITKNGFDPAFSVAPLNGSDIIRLREYLSVIDDGISDGAWKSFNFQAQDGNAVIIVTGKAEEYDGYSLDDDMRILVDGSGDSFDGPNTFNGDVDLAQPKTVVLNKTLSGSSHTIDIESRVTPVLYDVNVLASPNGSLVLNQELNLTAAADSTDASWQPPLWQSFNFSCDAGDVAVYISASADEEPNWNHVAFSIDGQGDDELRVVLDNMDYGWQTDSAWVGDKLFGDVKTVLIKETMSAGQHTLKLYAKNSPTVYRVLVYAQNGDYSLPVELSSFSAQRKEDRTIVRWKTESEINNLGFNIYRAESRDSIPPQQNAYIRLNERPIPGQGNSSSAHEYFYEDYYSGISPCSWYLLEDIAYSGAAKKYGPIMVANEESHLPVIFELQQNYPNPFNPETRIPFSIQEESAVRIDIINIYGQLIRTVWDGKAGPGFHEVKWDGKDEQGAAVTSGLYFYRMAVSDKTFIRKMTLIR